jgi:hypothetical protein
VTDHHSLAELLSSRSPGRILQALRQAAREPDAAAINWAYLREYSYNRVATQPEPTASAPGTSREELLDWARLSLFAIDNGRAAGVFDGPRARDGELALRCILISRIGPAEDGGPADPACALELFRTALPVTVDQAKTLAPRWRELETDQILALRRIRTRLHYLSWVPKEGLLAARRRVPDLAADPQLDLGRWFALQPLLP